MPYSSTMSFELFVHVIDLYAIDTQDSDIPSERIDPRLLFLSLALPPPRHPTKFLSNDRFSRKSYTAVAEVFLGKVYNLAMKVWTTTT